MTTSAAVARPQPPKADAHADAGKRGSLLHRAFCHPDSNALVGPGR